MHTNLEPQPAGDYQQGRTALLGERLRSSLTGYRIALLPHPALEGSVRDVAGRLRAVVITIAEPQLEIACWVRRGDPTEDPWEEEVVELRAALRASDDDGAGDVPLSIAAMVGDTIPWDSSDPQVEEILDALRVLIEEELPLDLAELRPNVHAAFAAAMRVYQNDPISPARRL